MYKEDLALNNLQRLICHKTKPNQIDVGGEKEVHAFSQRLLFYALRLGIHVHCMFRFSFGMLSYLKSFLHMVIYKIFLSNTNYLHSCMISSIPFYYP